MIDGEASYRCPRRTHQLPKSRTYFQPFRSNWGSGLTRERVKLHFSWSITPTKYRPRIDPIYLQRSVLAGLAQWLNDSGTNHPRRWERSSGDTGLHYARYSIVKSPHLDEVRKRLPAITRNCSTSGWPKIQ